MFIVLLLMVNIYAVLATDNDISVEKNTCFLGHFSVGEDCFFIWHMPRGLHPTMIQYNLYKKYNIHNVFYKEEYIAYEDCEVIQVPSKCKNRVVDFLKDAGIYCLATKITNDKRSRMYYLFFQSLPNKPLRSVCKSYNSNFRRFYNFDDNPNTKPNAEYLPQNFENNFKLDKLLLHSSPNSGQITTSTQPITSTTQSTTTATTTKTSSLATPISTFRSTVSSYNTRPQIYEKGPVSSNEGKPSSVESTRTIVASDANNTVLGKQNNSSLKDVKEYVIQLYKFPNGTLDVKELKNSLPGKKEEILKAFKNHPPSVNGEFQINIYHYYNRVGKVVKIKESTSLNTEYISPILPYPHNITKNKNYTTDYSYSSNATHTEQTNTTHLDMADIDQNTTKLLYEKSLDNIHKITKDVSHKTTKDKHYKKTLDSTNYKITDKTKKVSSNNTHEIITDIKVSNTKNEILEESHNNTHSKITSIINNKITNITYREIKTANSTDFPTTTELPTTTVDLSLITTTATTTTTGEPPITIIKIPTTTSTTTTDLPDITTTQFREIATTNEEEDDYYYSYDNKIFKKNDYNEYISGNDVTQSPLIITPRTFVQNQLRGQREDDDDDVGGSLLVFHNNAYKFCHNLYVNIITAIVILFCF